MAGGLKVSAEQTIFNVPDVVDHRNGHLVTRITVADGDNCAEVHQYDLLTKAQLAKMLRRLANWLDDSPA